jgi:hypothetical protein
MNRYIPFGYQIKNGETVINESEAADVSAIFKAYLSGASYLKIAEYMESKGIKYRQDSSKWNKNMVKRILENERYTGTNDYPKIIEISDFEKIPKTKPRKYIYHKPPDEKNTFPENSEPETYIYNEILEITRLSNTIKRELCNPQTDREKILNLILERAAVCYGRLLKSQQSAQAHFAKGVFPRSD